MKFVVRISFILCFTGVIVLFLLFIGIFHDRNSHELEITYGDYSDRDSDHLSTTRHRPRDYSSFERKVADYSHQYRLIWNDEVDKTDLWKRAAKWVTSRRIYREVPSELGEIWLPN